MREQHNDAAYRIVGRAFEIIVRLWPAGSRDWARAMQAELPEIMDANESLKWLAGGMMSLTHAWWNRILFGRGAQIEATRPIKSPGVWSAALLLIALGACALPPMRQGMTAVFDTWQGIWGRASDAQLEKMGRTAEQNHDAKALADVAMKLPVTEETLRWADLAVSLNPNLTWIYFEMEGGIPTYRMKDADFALRVARLEQWDPENAAPYLLEAGRVFDRFWMDSHGVVTLAKGTWPGASAELAKNPVWSRAMDQAFRAPKYDDYVSRRFDLNLSVMREHKMDRPVDLLFSIYSARIPDLLAIEVYADGLMHEGEAREAAGDLAGASELYWRVSHFANRMQLGSIKTSFERHLALGIAEKSFVKLQGVLTRAGRADEARFASDEAENAQATIQEVMAGMRRRGEDLVAGTWAALVIHLSAAVIVVTAFLSCTTLLWLALGFRSEETTRPTLRSWLCAVGRFSPAVMAFGVVLFLTTYVPYFHAFHDASPESMDNILRMFGGLLDVGVSLWPSSNPEVGVYFWSGFSALCSATVLVLIARMVLRARMDKTPA